MLTYWVLWCSDFWFIHLLHYRDGKMPVSSIQKYLVKKLDLKSEAEVSSLLPSKQVKKTNQSFWILAYWTYIIIEDLISVLMNMSQSQCQWKFDGNIDAFKKSWKKSSKLLLVLVLERNRHLMTKNAYYLYSPHISDIYWCTYIFLINDILTMK